MADSPSDRVCCITFILVGVMAAKLVQGQLDARATPGVTQLRHMRFEGVVGLGEFDLAGDGDQRVWIPVVPKDEVPVGCHAQVHFERVGT